MLLGGLTKPLINKLSGLADPEQWLIDWAGSGALTAAGEKISAETALTCAAVKAAVTVLAETVATVSLDVYRDRKSGGRDLATDHPVQHLLHDEPNEETASSTFRETLQGHLGTWGNGYAEIQRLRNGDPFALWQRSPRPGRTKPYRSSKDRKIYYECRDERKQLEANIPAADMFHIPGFGFDGLIGYDPIGHLREAIGLNKGAERYAAELFANDARPNGVVSVQGELSNKAYRRAKKQFNEDRSGQGRRHRLLLLEGGATFAEAQMNPENVQMIEARRFGIEEVARAYRISPHLLQDLTHGTFSNITELGRQFIVFTMMPWFTRWRSEINRKLLQPPYRGRFNYKSFLEADHKVRAEFYFRLWQMGARTVNEILAMEGDNSIGPEGNVRFVPVNMQPLTTAMQKPPAKRPAKEKRDPGAGGRGSGDEQQQSPPAPPRFERIPPDGRFADAARGVLADALGRMLRKETNAAKRAAKDPATWMTWLAPFYDRHGDLVAEALAPGCTVLVAADASYGSAAELARQFAQRHCDASRRALGGLKTDNGDGLTEQVDRLTAGWDPQERLEAIFHAPAHTA